MDKDVAALVERLTYAIEFNPFSNAAVCDKQDACDLLSALKAQAAEIVALKADLKTRTANWLSNNVADKGEILRAEVKAAEAVARAEAAEAKLREAVDLLLSAPLEPQCDWKCGEGTSHGPCNCNMREWLIRQSNFLSTMETRDE
jgi:hypothetical protein